VEASASTNSHNIKQISKISKHVTPSENFDDPSTSTEGDIGTRNLKVDKRNNLQPRDADQHKNADGFQVVKCRRHRKPKLQYGAADSGCPLAAIEK
jgi:hypothetical protein